MDRSDLAIVGLVALIIASSWVAVIVPRYLDAAEAQRKAEVQLKSYALETERKRVEAQAAYNRALEVSCVKGLVDKNGVVYERNE